MEAPRVSIVWMQVAANDRTPSAPSPSGGPIRLVVVDASSLELKILEGRVQGPVIAVVPTDDAAGRALRAGADEILRVVDATPEVIDRAVARAQSGTNLQLARRLIPRLDDAEPKAFTLLMRALCRQLGDSLTRAWGEYESIAQQVDSVIELNKQLAGWAALAAPPAALVQLRNQVSRVFSNDLPNMLQTASGSLHRAETLLENVQLLAEPAQETPVDMVIVLEELVELLREELRPWTDLRVKASEPCIGYLPSGFVACLVTAIIANAVESFRGTTPQWNGRIELRAESSDGIASIEVHDNGPSLPFDLDSATRDHHPRAGGLVAIRERARALGGELLVESDESGAGMTVRIFFDQTTTAKVVHPIVAALSALPAGALDGSKESEN